MLRSLITMLTCLFVLAACTRPPAPTAEQTELLNAINPYCGEINRESNDRTCNAFIVSTQGSAYISLLSGFDYDGYQVTLTYRGPRNILFTDKDPTFGMVFDSAMFRFVGPTDPDYANLNAQFLRLPQPAG